MSETDDPRKILAEAGVECAEVEEYKATEAQDAAMFEGWNATNDAGEAAILALSRLVAKYKWQRDAVLDRYALTVEGEWGVSHWPGDAQPDNDEDYPTNEEAREQWKARLIADLGKGDWDELHD